MNLDDISPKMFQSTKIHKPRNSISITLAAKIGMMMKRKRTQRDNNDDDESEENGNPRRNDGKRKETNFHLHVPKSSKNIYIPKNIIPENVPQKQEKSIRFSFKNVKLNPRKKRHPRIKNLQK